MALDPVVNFFRSTIATLPVASGGTQIVLQTGDGNKLPNPATDGAFNLTIYNANDPFVAPEIVRVTARSGDTLTVTRAQEGTSATNKTAGNTWNVELTPTAKTIQDINTDIVAKVAKTGDTMTGTLTATKLIPSGNVTAGNGMYLPATNEVAISTNGSERLRINATGAVTAGGTVTAGKLVPTANTTAGNGMYLPTTNTVAIGTNGTEALRVDASQRVAIGTTTQNMRFNVQNSGIVGGTERAPNASGTTVSIYTITCTATSDSTRFNIANGVLKVAIGSRSSSANAVATYTLPFMLSRVGRSSGIVILTQGTPTLLVATTSGANLNINTVAVALSSASNTGATMDITITTSGAQSPDILEFNTSLEITQHNKTTPAFTITAA
jgi:hypothetical protein